MSATFTDDGDTMITSGTEVIVWDVTDANRPFQLGRPLTGHTGPVGVLVAPNGVMTVTASIDDQPCCVTCRSSRS